MAIFEFSGVRGAKNSKLLKILKHAYQSTRNELPKVYDRSNEICKTSLQDVYLFHQGRKLFWK